MKIKTILVGIIGALLLISYIAMPIAGISVINENSNSSINSLQDTVSCLDNDPPDPPVITNCMGETERRFVTSGYAKLSYIFYVHYPEDPNGDQTQIRVDWDDGTQSKWFGPCDPDVTQLCDYEFKRSDTYSVKAQAKDVYGAISDWSDPFVITMYDHVDFEIRDGGLYTNPQEFGPGEKITICAEVWNIGSMDFYSTTYVVFKEVWGWDNEKELGRNTLDGLKVGAKKTVKLEDFKWFQDDHEHTILAEVVSVSDEYVDVNNIEYMYKSAPKTKMTLDYINQGFLKIIYNMPILKSIFI